MPDNLITEVGVGGIFAILVIREVIGFIKSRNNNSDNGCMHELRHEELKDLLKSINRNIEQQTGLLIRCTEKLSRLESR